MDLTPPTRTGAALRRLSSSSDAARLALAVGALIGLAPEAPGLPGGVAYAALDSAATESAPAGGADQDPKPSGQPASDQAPQSSGEPPAPPSSSAAAPGALPPADPAAPIHAPPPSAPDPGRAGAVFELPIAGELPAAPGHGPSPRVPRMPRMPRVPRPPSATQAPQRSAPAAQAREVDAAPADEQPAADSAVLRELPPAFVPDFFIRSFEIPPFLLSIYQAAGIEYGIRWEVLAAINEIESDYGRNLSVSTAGALGWMQFMPSTWAQYGVDANRDGRKDPDNPVDAIFAAARYLSAAGADRDLRGAIYAYNHAQWYVESVLMRARRIGGMPDDLVNALAGLSQGHLPVAAPARYGSGAAARGRRGISVHAARGAPAVAVQDGEIVRIGRSRRLGRFVMLRDVFGNTYTYGRLGTVVAQVPVPKERVQASSPDRLPLVTAADPVPSGPASAGSNRRATAAPETDAVPGGPASAGSSHPATGAQRVAGPPPAPVAKERLFANPGRPRSLRSGGRLQMSEAWTPLPLSASLRSYLTGPSGVRRADVVLKRLVPGRRIVAGTVLGRIDADRDRASPHMRFEIRPAGRGAPRIDPLPIVRGWRLLDATAIHRTRTWNMPGDPVATLGQIMLMSKQALARRVLANPAIDVYGCGRRDIRVGAVDRRVLATLEYLAASNLRPTVTSLRCGHSRHTAAGNLSAHPSGNAVDIAKVNGIPILGNQGPGSIGDLTVRWLLSLQGMLEPAQIISLIAYEGHANTLALGDHADHIHVGFSTAAHAGGAVLTGGLRSSQWTKLIDRVRSIKNPTVSVTPSRHAVTVTRAQRTPSGTRPGR